MKLSLGKGGNAQTATPRIVAATMTEIDALYARLRDNPYSDSDSVRITIVGTMVYLLATRLSAPNLYK
jgi:hypothetical protein